MAMFKKFFGFCTLVAGFTPFVASAEVRDLRTVLNFNSDVRVAAEKLVQKIKDDPNNNHFPIPGHNAYSNLHLVSVDPSFSGILEIDDTTQTLTHYEVTAVSFEALGVPLFSNYKATLKLSADITPDCKLVNGTRSYEVVSSNSSLVDAMFKKDLTGRNYNPKYEAYGDVVFESMLQTNEELRAFCHN